MRQLQWVRRCFAAMACAGLLSAALWAGPAAALDKVKFNLAWFPQGSTGGVLIAINKGFYRDAGLEVSPVIGHGGQRTVNEIDQGLFEFGYGDPISVMLNRAQGGKTVMVGAINTVWPGALCYLEKPGRTLARPADLKGLTLGGGGASPVQNLLPAWFKRNGLPADTVKLLSLDPSTINQSFLQGRIDLAECWEGANEPVLQALAARQGRRVGAMRYRDFGLDMVGNGIVTTEKMITEHPDVVRRFVQATYRGYDYLQQHPEEAATIIAGQYPMLDKQVMLEQVREINGLIIDSKAKGHKLGWLNTARMDSTVKFVRQAFHLPAGIKSTDIYTNQFVE